MNKIDLLALIFHYLPQEVFTLLTLEEPARHKPVLDPLAVHHLENRLFIYVSSIFTFVSVSVYSSSCFCLYFCFCFFFQFLYCLLLSSFACLSSFCLFVKSWSFSVIVLLCVFVLLHFSSSLFAMVLH